MKFRNAMMYAAPFVLATTLSAGSAQAFFYNDVEELRDRAIAGDSFNAELAREYRELVNFEWNKMYDWGDAEKHATKANMAAEGETPMPYVPASWGIESQANLDELEAARTRLMAALDNGGRTGFPNLAAEAQAKYDCWVEQQEEGHQEDHIAACKTDFWAAMGNLEDAMKPAMVKTVISQELDREVVYFNFDQAEITPAARLKIDAFVERMKPHAGAEIVISGHTDTVGSSEYNRQLSERRAEAVATELVRQGMNVRVMDAVALVAEGETDLAVKTEDGVREQLNRRVEMRAIGEVQVEQQVSRLTAK